MIELDGKVVVALEDTIYTFELTNLDAARLISTVDVKTAKKVPEEALLIHGRIEGTLILASHNDKRVIIIDAVSGDVHSVYPIEGPDEKFVVGDLVSVGHLLG